MDTALADSGTPPEPDWFHDGPLQAACKAHRVLAEIVPAYIFQRVDLTKDFKPAVLDLALEELRERFANQHTGLRRFGGAYRADTCGPTMSSHAMFSPLLASDQPSPDQPSPSASGSASRRATSPKS